MLKKYYTLKIYRRTILHCDLLAEIMYYERPSDETIEKEILHYAGCDGVGEIIEQFKPVVPFA